MHNNIKIYSLAGNISASNNSRPETHLASAIALAVYDNNDCDVVSSLAGLRGGV